mmetsp:Transcript_18743/g.28067  ORF Transcript_18743/g.28067 Transcript_18743/m.28067 type:complete len:925 (-) Transcript_18743:181-2955(-)
MNMLDEVDQSALFEESQSGMIPQIDEKTGEFTSIKGTGVEIGLEDEIPEVEIEGFESSERVLPESFVQANENKYKTSTIIEREPASSSYWPFPPMKPKAYRGLERHIRAGGIDGEFLGDGVDKKVIPWLQNASIVDEKHPKKQLMPSRSFRIGWGPGGKMIIPGSNGKVTVCSLDINISEVQKKLSKDLLKTHCQVRKSEMKSIEDGKNVTTKLGLCREYIGVVERSISEDNKNSTPNDPIRFQLSVWKLIDQLWSRKGASRSSCLAALGSWLSKTAESEMKEAINDEKNDETIIWNCLTGHNFPMACKAARNGQNWRLSVLLAQAGKCQRNSRPLMRQEREGQITPAWFQQDLFQQMRSWKESKLKSHISHGLRKIYGLLSGDMKTIKVQAQDRSISWLRAFGLFLWFAESEGKKSVESVLKSYLDATKSSDGPAVRPYPPHLSIRTSNNMRTDIRLQDLRLSLLELYTKAEHEIKGGMAQLLVPEKSVPSLLDYTLSWHLHEVFCRPGIDLKQILTVADGEYYREEAFHRVAVLIVSYASQLEAIGEWKWAIYVIMDASRSKHLRCYIRHETVVKEILCRHAPSSSITYSGDDPEDPKDIISNDKKSSDFGMEVDEKVYDFGGKDEKVFPGFGNEFGSDIRVAGRNSGPYGMVSVNYSKKDSESESLRRQESPELEVKTMEEEVELLENKQDREGWGMIRAFLENGNECGVPSSWIDNALAIRCANDGDSKCALYWYLRAGEWEQAHRVLMEKIVPDCFASGREMDITWELVERETKPESENASLFIGSRVALSPLLLLQKNSSSIKNWSKGGAVVIDYLTATNRWQGSSSDFKIEQAVSRAKNFMLGPNSEKNQTCMKRRFVCSEIISALLNVASGRRAQAEELEIDKLLCSVNEHQRLDHLDRHSLLYLTKKLNEQDAFG